MIQKIINILKHSSTVGSYFPAAYDADKQAPSVSLYFAHVAHLVSIVAICILIYKDINAGTIAAITYSVITMILYMMRRISSVKADLDDKSFEIEGGENEK